MEEDNDQYFLQAELVKQLGQHINSKSAAEAYEGQVESLFRAIDIFVEDPANELAEIIIFGAMKNLQILSEYMIAVPTSPAS